MIFKIFKWFLAMDGTIIQFTKEDGPGDLQSLRSNIQINDAFHLAQKRSELSRNSSAHFDCSPPLIFCFAKNRFDEGKGFGIINIVKPFSDILTVIAL